MIRVPHPFEPTPPGHKPATEKQVRFANAIANTLHIHIPYCNSCEVYRDWISSHIDDFKKVDEMLPRAEDADDNSPEAEYYFEEAMRW